MVNFQKLKQALLEKLEDKPISNYRYLVPSIWIDPYSKDRASRPVHPIAFFLDALRRIENHPPRHIETPSGGDWSPDAIVYNMYVRSTLGFDHDGDGSIATPINGSGFREVGTFMKAIALLPYIQSLGTNTIHLLPVTAIGRFGKKGTLGAPYAIRNPYKLDEMLSEPLIGVGPDVEFGAFVESAHRLGLRVVVEFVFRTAARDSDWIREHPEWFYWIRANISELPVPSTSETQNGAPIFTQTELSSIIELVKNGNRTNLIPPHAEYRLNFTQPPARETIIEKNGQLIGRLADGSPVRVPGAFADWPPNDAQPPWDDVTYLRMYEHPDFNYIAYNTLRMYDERLAQPEHAVLDLWERIAGIIPHYQNMFGIDGVMIDMGHALPPELKRNIIERARIINPSFAFWDENFSVKEETRKEGYNAVIGYCWVDQHDRNKFRQLLNRCETAGFPLPFFATPESHNTPRAAARSGAARYSRVAWFMGNFLPAIPFLHSGFELEERLPINTGLNFSRSELEEFPPSKLPLFSEASFDWSHTEDLVEWIRKIGKLRERFKSVVIDSAPSSFRLFDTGNEYCLAFGRGQSGEQPMIVILGSYDFDKPQQCRISIPTRAGVATDLLTDISWNIVDGSIEVHLEPGGCRLFVF